MKLSQLGWVVAASIVGVSVGGGFQTKSDKTAVVNMQAVYQESNLKKKNDDHLRSTAQSRQAAIDFLSLFPALNRTQLDRFEALSVKEAPTAAETSELAKLKTDAQAATTQYDGLRQKPNPSPQDIATLNDLGGRTNLDAQERVALARQFGQELDKLQADLNTRATDAIKAAIAQVAKPQGYTLVFRENTALYGSRDLGTEVKKIVDKNAK